MADLASEVQNSIDVGKAYMNLGHYDQAIDCFKKSLQMATAIRNQYGIVHANMYLADVYERLKDYEKAISCLRKVSSEISTATNLGIAISDQRRIADINCNLGIFCSELKRNEEAIQCFEEMLRLMTAIGDQKGIAESNSRLGRIYLNLSEYEKASAYFKHALNIYIFINDKNGIKDISNELGRVHCSLGEHSKAIECHRKSLEIAKTVHDQAGMARANFSLSVAHQGLKDYEKAIICLKDSLEIGMTIKDKLVMAVNNGQLAIIYNCLEKCEIAIEYCKKTLELGTEIGDQGIIADAKCTLGKSNFRLGRNDEALLCFEEMLRLMTAIGDQNGIAEANMYLGKVYQRMKDYEKAISFLKVSLEISTAISDQPSMAEQNRSLGDIYLCVEKWEIAIDYYKKTLELGIAIRDQRENPNVNCNLGICYSKLNRNQDAVQSYEEMIRLTTAIGDQKGIAESNRRLGRMYLILSEYENASAYFKNALNIYNTIGDKNGIKDISNDLGHVHVNLGEYSKAIDCFRQSIEMANTVGDKADFTPTDLPKAAEEVVSLSKLFTARPLVKAEAKKQVVLGLLSGASIIHIAAHGEPKKGEIMLAPDLSLNEPSSSPPNQDSYLLTQNDITSISLHARLVVLCCCHTGQGKISSEGVIGIARSFLAAGARSVLATLWPISDDATKEFMEAFYGELLQETLVCEALRRVMNLFQQHEREDYRSILIWAPFTVYGEDVMFSKGDIETIREKSSETLPECGFALFVGNPTSDLPRATEEVNCLSQLFTTKPFVEGEARKEVLLGLLSGASIIHISAHIEPKQCAIMLSPCLSSNQGSLTLPKQDDFFTQQDVQNISLKGSLVVLCLSHSEQDEISPEGVETLALSFLAAGARSVLTTLRHSDDDATTEFIKAFYSHLLHESSVREALEKTKELFEKRDEEAYRSFVGGAPFTIYGEDLMFQKHDVETIKEKSRKMFSDFVVLPPLTELTGSFENLHVQNRF
ncbi:tetratricopeptide repeat protein 28-like isoform X2 [Dendronephthya gigantea]|uniref:tetratricopeptide repeat protein 28-like isoform X2 n=1 Tax=Dendronephthya gigantea TaxID=151771 RepID=UPI00106AB250|nr:tetratricopeptide repeat protein 28-like isoform X2 [Dendronephthya gigantea]